MGSVTHIPVTGRKINSTDYHEEHLLDLDTTDITDALGYVPVNKAGDTMTGNLLVRGNELQVGPLIGTAQDGLITINNTKTYSGFWLKSRDTAGGSELLDGLITSFRGYGLILSGDPALSLRISGDEIAQISSTGMNIATGKALTVPDEAYGPAWNGKTEVPTKNAVYDALAASHAFRGALVYQTASQTGANYFTGAPVAIPWDAESYDTDSIHDNATNNTRLTVPAGVTKVRLVGGASISNSTSGNFHELSVYKNGSLSYPGMAGHRSEVTVTGAGVPISSPVLDVVAGDYFEMRLTSETDTAIDLNSPRTWFAMEIIA